MTDKHQTDAEREAEAKRILERIEQDAETVGTSSMRRVAERVKKHVSADDKDHNAWAELWGTRIGRGLGIIFALVLIIYLVRTYILHV